MASIHSSRATNFTNSGYPHLQPPLGDSDMNADTAALITKFALDDIEDAISGSKGKSRFNAPLFDEQLASKLQSQNFEEWLAYSEDAKYAQSLNVASATDSAYLDTARACEIVALEDRCVAEMLSRREALPPPTAAQELLGNPGSSVNAIDPELCINVF